MTHRIVSGVVWESDNVAMLVAKPFLFYLMVALKSREVGDLAIWMYTRNAAD